MLCCSNRKITKPDRSWNWRVACGCEEPEDLFFKELWKSLGLWNNTVAECLKQSLCHPTKTLKVRKAESIANYVDPAQEVSGRNNISIRARDHYWDILANNVVSFFHIPCPKNMPEARLKNNMLVSLVENMSRLSNIVWLFIITSLQVYDFKKVSRVRRNANCTTWKGKKHREIKCLS